MSELKRDGVAPHPFWGSVIQVDTRQVGHGDAAISYGSGEKPRYAAIRRAADRYYGDLVFAVASLRTKIGHSLAMEITKSEPPPFEYNRRLRRLVDGLVGAFLDEIAGPDRSEAGFVQGGIESETPDGIIQGQNILCYAVGLQRGSDLLNRAQTLQASRNNPATEKMLSNAFARLSQGGEMRLEGVRDDIHGILTSAARAGLNPLETARQLGQQFDQYEGWEFQRLARTEAAYASEEGVREQLESYGVSHYIWLISDGACPICQGYVGQIIEAGDTDNLPPSHPNCACASAPAGIGEMML